jgi:hypothetical protein
MSSKSKHLLLVVLLAVVAASGVTVWSKFEPVVESRELQAAKRVFSGVSDVSRIEIFRMKGEEADHTTTTFPIKPYGKDSSTYGTVVLGGQQAQEFLSVWRRQKVAMKMQALCHYPTYGFRFYREQDMVTETSICWFCSNYFYRSVDGGYRWAGFDSLSSESKELLRLCDSLLPYKRPATAEEVKEMKSAE